jgi:hypothetical protein
VTPNSETSLSYSSRVHGAADGTPECSVGLLTAFDIDDICPYCLSWHWDEMKDVPENKEKLKSVLALFTIVFNQPWNIIFTTLPLKTYKIISLLYKVQVSGSDPRRKFAVKICIKLLLPDLNKNKFVRGLDFMLISVVDPKQLVKFWYGIGSTNFHEFRFIFGSL